MKTVVGISPAAVAIPGREAIAGSAAEANPGPGADTAASATRRAQASPTGAAALGLIYSVLTETELDPGLRVVAILQVAQRSHAAYAFAQHASIARAAGVNQAQISSLQDGGAPACLFGDRERTVLAFAAEALDAPRVSGETFARLREHLPPRQVVELLLTIGCFRMMSRLVTILELESEPPFGVNTLRQAALQHRGPTSRGRSQSTPGC